MKINYKALWIDDQFEYVQSAIDAIKDRLEDYGFKFEVDKKTSLSEDDLRELSHKLSQYNPYDIIIFDYDLGEQTKKGNEIARVLRQSIFTDMIFYSGKASGDLRKILFESQVEGVFTVSRPDFVDEAWPIIEDQIKRICDINNMRGVILDEMSKIDLTMRKLYNKKYVDMLDEEKERQVKNIRKKLEERQKNIKDQVKEVNSETLPGMITDPIKTDFNIVRMRLTKLCNDDEILGEKGKLIRNQSLRNQFAHNMAIYDEENGTVSLHGFDKVYNFDDFKDIRNELIDILKRIEKLKHV
ncbi:hypothetical protein QUF80_11220 [Desulfococcaceae bacterium HSG8]|nr:hypothetical protein [Desulfococcaceae bacterium HSG8]